MRYIFDTYVFSHWSFDPFVILVALLVIWHEAGLASLARRSRPDRTRERRLRSLWFYAGLAVLLLAVDSPVDYWADSYFLVHMIQHLLLMFAAPTLVVKGAPWQPLLDALPGRSGKSVTRSVMTGGWSRPFRAVGSLFLRPWVAIISFNVVMVFWHLPGPFDLAEENQYVHIWLMHSSFFVSGVLFWLQYIQSPPFRARLDPVGRAAGLLLTNVVMIFIAMALSIFVSTSVYSVYAHVPGVTLPPYADQQLGAAILWVCGDFWALPTMVLTIRKLTSDDAFHSAFENYLRRRSRNAGTVRGWASAGRSHDEFDYRVAAAGPAAAAAVTAAGAPAAAPAPPQAAAPVTPPEGSLPGAPA
jgi:putative membrane protein